MITTHKRVDAKELWERVAFIVGGKIEALDTPKNLMKKKGAKTVTYSYIENGQEVEKEILLEKIADDQILKEKIENNKLLTIHSMEPDLGDIFMEVTGRRLS